MRWYLDVTFNRREGGTKVFGPDKWIIPNNWKNSADNFIGDGYHASISHRSATMVLRSYRTMAGSQPKGKEMAPYSRPGNQISAGNGHGTGGVSFAESDEQYWAMIAQFTKPELVEYEKSIRGEVEERLGYDRAYRIRTAHHTVWPNFSYLGGGVMRLWLPRGPLHTEVWAWGYTDAEAPESIQHMQRISAMQTFGPSGLLEQDDMDNWRGSSEAGKSPIARKYVQDISMGVGHESSDPRLPAARGILPKAQGEHPQRNMYLTWQQYMNAESWADIPLDPTTAKFEGTATMKG